MILKADNLTFKYSEAGRTILDSVSLELNKGQILCILGPNGSGKTTLLNCLAGLLKPQAGSIELCGKQLESMSEREIARSLALVPQLHTPGFDYTAFDFVLMGCANRIGYFGRPSAEDEAKVRKLMQEMNIDYLAEKSYLDISGGERQQLLIARAIAQEPEVILFDEPTAYLDYGNQHRILNKILEMAKAGFSVVITTHNPDHAFILGDRLAIVDKDGSLIQGKCEDIISEELLSRIYGIDIKLKYIEEIGRRVCITPGASKE